MDEPSSNVTDTTPERSSKNTLGEIHGNEVSGSEEIWVNTPEEFSVSSLTAPPSINRVCLPP